MSKLGKRVENLEDFLDTQSRINNQLFDSLRQNYDRIMKLEKKIVEKPNIPYSLGKKNKRCKKTYAEYKKLVDEALYNGDLIGAFEIAATIELIPEKDKRSQALENMKSYYKKQNWRSRKGEYTVANWFCFQPMSPKDIDGEELTESDTLYKVLPLMTRRQAWKFINDNIENLTNYFGV